MIKQLESSYRGERKKRGAKVRRPRTENNGYEDKLFTAVVPI